MNHVDELAGYQGDPDFMASLARGLLVLSAFSEQKQSQSITEISKITGLSRAAVRRCLYTLVQTGYARQENTGFMLEPKVLTLGYAYLSSTSIVDAAQPFLDRIRNQLHESSSIGVMEDDQVFYVGRSEATRVMSMSLRVGSRLPAYCTSMGRVILANMPKDKVESILDKTELKAYTNKTITTKSALLTVLEETKKLGYSIVDQELEEGLRSIAVPVFDQQNNVVAAINVGTHAGRVTMAELKGRFLAEIKDASNELSKHNKYMK